MSFSFYVRLLVALTLASSRAIAATENYYLEAYATHFGIPLLGAFRQTSQSTLLSQSFQRVSDLNSARVTEFVEENPTAVDSLVRYVHSLPNLYITDRKKRILLFQIVSTLARLEERNTPEPLLSSSQNEIEANTVRSVSQTKEVFKPQPRTFSYELSREEPAASNIRRTVANPQKSYLRRWRVGGGVRSTEPIFSNGNRTTRTVNGVVVEDSTTFETTDSSVIQGFLDTSYRLPNLPIRLGGTLLAPISMEHRLYDVTLKHSRPWVLAPYVEINSPLYFGRAQPFVSYSAYSYDTTMRLPLDDSAYFPLAYRQDIQKISAGIDYHWLDGWLIRLVSEFVSSKYDLGNILSGEARSTEIGLGIFKAF